MKRLEFFPLTYPHHPREAFVMAVDEGREPRLIGITVWEADPEPRAVEVGPVKETLHTAYSVSVEQDTQSLVSEAAEPGTFLAEPPPIDFDWSTGFDWRYPKRSP